MKTNLFFAGLVAIFFSFFVVSCDQPTTQPKTGPGVSKTTLCETPVTVKVKQTATKYSCNGIPNGEKVTGEKDSTFLVIQETNCAYSDRDLNIAGYQYTGNVPVSPRPSAESAPGMVIAPPVAIHDSVAYPKTSPSWWSDFWGFHFSGNFWSDLLKFIGWLALIALLLTLLILALGLLRRAWYWMMERFYSDDYYSRSYYYRDHYYEEDCDCDRVRIPVDSYYIPANTSGVARDIRIRENGQPSQELLDVLRSNGGSMADKNPKGSGGYNLNVKAPAPPANKKPETPAKSTASPTPPVEKTPATRDQSVAPQDT